MKLIKLDGSAARNTFSGRPSSTAHSLKTTDTAAPVLRWGHLTIQLDKVDGQRTISVFGTVPRQKGAAGQGDRSPTSLNFRSWQSGGPPRGTDAALAIVIMAILQDIFEDEDDEAIRAALRSERRLDELLEAGKTTFKCRGGTLSAGEQSEHQDCRNAPVLIGPAISRYEALHWSDTAIVPRHKVLSAKAYTKLLKETGQKVGLTGSLTQAVLRRTYATRRIRQGHAPWHTAQKMGQGHNLDPQRNEKKAPQRRTYGPAWSLLW